MAISVNFSGTPRSGATPLTVNFTNLSTGYDQMVFSGVSPASKTYRGLKTSSDGQYILAYSNSTSGVYISNDFGKSWINNTTLGGATTRNWAGGDLSYDGRNMVCVYDGGSIWYSQDYGSGWLESDSGLKSFANICLSYSGTYAYAAAMALSGSGIFTSNNSGVNWTHRACSHVGNWYDIKTTVDGSVVVATSSDGYSGYVYISEDYGVTWVNHPSGYINDYASEIGLHGDINNYYIYLASRGGSSAKYLKYYSKSSNTWSNLTTMPQEYYDSIYISRKYPDLIYQPPILIAATQTAKKCYVSLDYGSTYEVFSYSNFPLHLVGTDRMTTEGHYRVYGSFSSNISGGIYHLQYWTFGDATTSFMTNPSKVYTTRGSYDVTLGIDYNNNLTQSGYINTLRTHIVNISGGLIKSWTTVDGSGSLPTTPNTHTITMSGGLIKNWTINASGTRTAHNHSVSISGGLVKSWTVT